MSREVPRSSGPPNTTHIYMHPSKEKALKMKLIWVELVSSKY